jgi:hypothetical protein
MQVGPENQSIRWMICLWSEVRHDVAGFKNLYSAASCNRALISVNPQEFSAKARLPAALQDLSGNALPRIVEASRVEFPIGRLLRPALD